MTLAQQRNRLTTNFLEGIPVVKRRMAVHNDLLVAVWAALALRRSYRCLIGLLWVNRRISFVKRAVVTSEPRTQIMKDKKKCYGTGIESWCWRDFSVFV